MVFVCSCDLCTHCASNRTKEKISKTLLIGVNRLPHHSRKQDAKQVPGKQCSKEKFNVIIGLIA